MKNIVTTILLFFCVSIGFAQGKSTDERASALTAKMQSEIKFNDETKVKVQAINVDFLNKVAASKTADGDRKERFKAVKQYDDERAEALKKVFTPTEYAAFEKFRENNKAQARERVREKRD